MPLVGLNTTGFWHRNNEFHTSLRFDTGTIKLRKPLGLRKVYCVPIYTEPITGVRPRMAEVNHRTLGLGIDTGGTFTDAAIVDMRTMRVLATSNSPATYSALSIGMLGAVDGVLASGSFSTKEIRLIGLSTTLATNSILTGKGGTVGLICIGWTPEPGSDLGTKMVHTVAGGHTVGGLERVPLNTYQLENAIVSLVGQVDAIVGSGIFSVHNPEHEDAARRMILQRSRQLVVAGHDLTSELGI